ncbi:MAG: hypothetical protein WC291_01750 [Thermodesulfovibrionales bacterium]|jgi:hypothetical protein
MKTIAWFSAGVSSAVAIKMGIAEIDEVIYIHINDQHPDTLRFVKDCEEWFGRPITILQSPYRSVEGAIKGCPQRLNGSGYINGPRGASCTRYLKRRVRKEWECDNQWFNIFRYVWGMDCEEATRAGRLRETMPEAEHVFPLMESSITKEEAHGILRRAGVKRPAMYELGYHNNNCVGCVKGGMGYWNKVRVDFPDVFEARAKLEREVGASCINGVFLDELEPTRGRHGDPICDDCGILCELMVMKEAYAGEP